MSKSQETLQTKVRMTLFYIFANSDFLKTAGFS